MESNRVEICGVVEVTAGVTPNRRFSIARFTGEGLGWRPDFYASKEIRADRMSFDPVKISEMNSGPLEFEYSYPDDSSFWNHALRSAMYADWVWEPFADNAVINGSIAGIVGSTGTVTVTDQTSSTVAVGYAGTAFKQYHLVRLSGFTNAANNGLFDVASSTTTTVVMTGGAGAGLVNETPSSSGAARMKAVGIQATSGDLVCTTTGMTSTALNFTTIPAFVVGAWIKIGGTGTTRRFANEANNGFARIASVAANAITLDHRPVGWAADAGTGKAVRIWISDNLRNGVIPHPMSIQRRFLDMSPIVRIIHRGMHVASWSMSAVLGDAVKGSFQFEGLSGSLSTSADYANFYRVAPTWRTMTANNNVTALYEGGVLVAAPNYVQEFSFTVNNNIRSIGGLGANKPQAINVGEAMITGMTRAYFGTNALFDALMAGTSTSYAQVLTNGSQAVIHSFPRVTYTGGSPNAPGKNTDIVLPLEWMTSYDPVTGAEILIDRFEYFEA